MLKSKMPGFKNKCYREDRRKTMEMGDLARRKKKRN